MKSPAPHRIDLSTHGRGPRLSPRGYEFYKCRIRPLLPEKVRQFVKLLGFLWGYRLILVCPHLPLKARFGLIVRFLRIDYNIPRGHWPSEIAHVCKSLAERPANPGEVMVEAGCWQGCSSAKFSILCKMLGYRLFIYDSFQGVEPTDQPGYDFSGEYAADQALLEKNIERFGEPDVCHFVPGWFADTLARAPVEAPVRCAFIDCDLAKGTLEVLQGVLPSLTPDAAVFSQDYHIPAVQQVLQDPATWQRLRRRPARIEFLMHCLARIHIASHGSISSRTKLPAQYHR